SQPSVAAWGHVQLSILGAVVVTASAGVSVLIEGNGDSVAGGIQTKLERDTPAQWCEYYGVPVKDGVAILYKALASDFTSRHGFSYQPGSVPMAPDWDDGQTECGGGLHFSPNPKMALEFAPEAGKFVGCPVSLSDIVVHPDGQYPQKVKARGCCGPVFEVDENGKPVGAASGT
ncbi:MAG TPA: hypothetical protein VE986_04585, partial [Hyphomicrobiales bacterium]|nr:hypothetical protein [Hyphomicrobiales bacterium]